MISRLNLIVAICALFSARQTAFPQTNHLTFAADPDARFEFTGFAEDRIRANVENWLIPAPLANPGLLSMFDVRDREPRPNLVPWAGEFAGKYLISAIQALRMSKNAQLRATVERVVAQLIASQAEDGYLGPFRKEERLRGHWDLWGHYHCMLGLLMWHEQTGNTNALGAARKAADLVCNTYLDTGKRAFDAGSDEMNLAIIHSLGWLYRITNEDRYLRMMREIEKDWERGGDYFRAGLAGTEFFQTKRPRWESLHNIQGLVELYRITGEEKYRTAFENLWRSIARWDLRNTGGFSSGEQATGNPYSSTPIETCCSIAWMAMSTDMLALIGEPEIADLLELATYNAWAGAQHPSGRWCTYNTPMDGVREASAHTIVFQSRHGTPELNCCSVNAPRGWGMLSEWAFMRSADGFVINWLAPGNAVFTDTVTNSQPLVRQFSVSGNYPVESNIEIRMELPHEEEFTLRIRIPEWSKKTRAWMGDRELSSPEAGSYLTIKRKWPSGRSKNDTVKLALDLTPRVVNGAREAAGKASLYRGPILLAADQRFNASDQAPILSPNSVSSLRLEQSTNTNDTLARVFNPMLIARITAADGAEIRLCDFASAGATGTRYWSWLPMTNSAPAPVVARQPRDSSTIAKGTLLFRWTRPPTNAAQFLQFNTDPSFSLPPTLELPVTGHESLVKIDSKFERTGWWHWRIVSSNQFGLTPGEFPFARFRIDPSLPVAEEELRSTRTLDAQGNIAASPALLSFNGTERKIFEVAEWPEENYSVTFRFRVRSFPTNRIAQLFSAWAGPLDDPLRVTIDNGKISARIESGGGFATTGVPIETGRWYDLSAIKDGSKLSLLIDGQERAHCTVPEFITSRANDFALGGNPHYTGNEFVDAEIEKMRFRSQ